MPPLRPIAPPPASPPRLTRREGRGRGGEDRGEKKIRGFERRHSGRDQAISAPDICRELGWPMKRERLVRQIISDESHLWTGVLVCGVPSAGYFCAADIEEVHKYRNWIADLFHKAADKLRKVDEACTRMGIRFARETPPARAHAHARNRSLQEANA